MKTPCLLFLLLATLWSHAQSPNAEQTIEQQIEGVTVFLNNAEIYRSGTIRLPPGKSDVLFDNLSSKILNKGIKIKLSGEAKVYAAGIERKSLPFDKQPPYLALVDSIGQLERQRDSILSILKVWEKNSLFLEANMRVSTNASFAQIEQAERFFDRKVKAIQNNIRLEKRALAQVDTQLDRSYKRRTQLQQRLAKDYARVRITIDSQEAGDCQIDLRYLVSNALWKPIYAIRADKGDRQLTFEYQAQLYNDTGVDWIDKPMTLAILDSSDDIDMPAMTIWNLESDRESHRKGQIYRFEADKAKDNEEQAVDVLEIDDLSTRFELDKRYKVSADASPHLIDVISYQKEVDFYTLSIPKVKNGAFLIARITDWESLGLIDGTANLYYNNAYQGSTNLQAQQLNDTLDISLGRDNAFSLSRKKISSKSRKNLIGFNIKETITYEILIKNNKAERNNIRVKDQIPISSSKDVEVNIQTISGGQLEPLPGEITWDLILEPNETKRLLLRFTIKYPKSKRNSIKYNVRKVVTPRYF
ncbi:MAG: mucoidy inhibitor MuiA family protein [Bacteroidota bacterium]